MTEVKAPTQVRRVQIRRVATCLLPSSPLVSTSPSSCPGPHLLLLLICTHSQWDLMDFWRWSDASIIQHGLIASQGLPYHFDTLRAIYRSNHQDGTLILVEWCMWVYLPFHLGGHLLNSYTHLLEFSRPYIWSRRTWVFCFLRSVLHPTCLSRNRMWKNGTDWSPLLPSMLSSNSYCMRIILVSTATRE